MSTPPILSDDVPNVPQRPSFLLSVVGIAHADGSFGAYPLVRVRHDTLYAICGLYPINIALDARGLLDTANGEIPGEAQGALEQMRSLGATPEQIAAARSEFVRRAAIERVLSWLRAPEVRAMLGFVSTRDAITTDVVRVASAMLWGPLALRDDTIGAEYLPTWTTLIVKGTRKRMATLGVGEPASDVPPEVLTTARRLLSLTLNQMREERAADKAAREAALQEQVYLRPADGRDE